MGGREFFKYDLLHLLHLLNFPKLLLKVADSAQASLGEPHERLSPRHNGSYPLFNIGMESHHFLQVYEWTMFHSYVSSEGKSYENPIKSPWNFLWNSSVKVFGISRSPRYRPGIAQVLGLFPVVSFNSAIRFPASYLVICRGRFHWAFRGRFVGVTQQDPQQCLRNGDRMGISWK